MYLLSILQCEVYKSLWSNVEVNLINAWLFIYNWFSSGVRDLYVKLLLLQAKIIFQEHKMSQIKSNKKFKWALDFNQK